MRVFLTGSCGFIGSHLVRLLLETPELEQVTSLDSLTYAGNLKNLAGLEDDRRHRFVRGDITDGGLVDRLLAEGRFDALINCAAESHVDRSIESAAPFLRTNVLGTQILLEAARRHNVRRFLQVSTDEVYGSLDLDSQERFHEATPLQPSSPYAASKAAGDFLVLAAHHTHGQDTVITRCSNNYGPRQFPEKLIPLMTLNALRDIPLPVYGDGRNVRDWIHVGDHCTGIVAALQRGRPGEVYNLSADNEWANLDLVRLLLRLLGKPESLIAFVRDRPGHDRRYAIDSTKARHELAWTQTTPFEEGLRETIRWYCHNEAWWKEIISGEYKNYYERMYAGRELR